MTDNTKLKEDTEKLFQVFMWYSKKYRRTLPILSNKTGPFTKVETEIRNMLYILRTNEENYYQQQTDSRC